ncbi:MAG: NifU family protein [Patescibacteria group bacterium]
MNNTDFLKLNIDDQVRLINEALSEQVYSALEMDGGGMEIMDIEGTDVLIRYHGACGNCPIAESGTLVFIQSTLQEKIDPRIQVKIV